MDKILIVNTGGTFNKIYNPIKGTLDIDREANSIKSILSAIKVEKYKLINIIGKDSLDITKQDRMQLLDTIVQYNYKKIIIIHGTDTIDKTAKFLDKYIKNKQIILTGAMVPFSIDPIEATSNFSLALGYIQSNKKNGIYIAMHSFVKLYKDIYKNRKLGVFKLKNGKI